MVHIIVAVYLNVIVSYTFVVGASSFIDYWYGTIDILLLVSSSISSFICSNYL